MPKLQAAILYFLSISSLIAEEVWEESISLEGGNLFEDLAIVEEIDKKETFELPLIMNYQNQGGYFTMPSARMANVGNVGFGFSSVEPYYIYNANFQYFDHWEITASYWVFKGVTEANFGHLGFGDDADRTASLKYSIFRKQI